MSEKRTKLQQKHYETLKQKRDQIQERKARTRRLIIRGAIAEKVFPNSITLSDTEFEQMLFRMSDIVSYYESKSFRSEASSSQSVLKDSSPAKAEASQSAQLSEG